jgi:chromate transporter
MHRDLVVERRWIDETRFRDGLAFAQLAPGPMAAQLAMYIGWLRAGPAGVLACAGAFILPAFLFVVVAAAMYSDVARLAPVSAALYGAGAGVIAVIARSGYRLATASLRRDRLLWLLCSVNFALVALTGAEHVWAIAASALAVWALRAHTGQRASGRAMLAVVVFAVPDTGRLGHMFWLFVKSGSVVFGSGLAIVPYLYGGVVNEHHWLTDRQFLDAVALGMLAPGPMVITVALMGYLIAGLPGAVVGLVGVFLPVLVIVIVAAPHVSRITSNPAARAAVDGAVAAAIGSLLGAVVILGRRSLADGLAWGIALGASAVLFSGRRVPDAAVIGGAALAGMLLRGLL